MAFLNYLRRTFRNFFGIRFIVGNESIYFMLILLKIISHITFLVVRFI